MQISTKNIDSVYTNNASSNTAAFRQGLHDGIPIGLGYFAVAFSLGIICRSSGLTVFQSFLTSLLNNTSAGEFAAITLIGQNASYTEIALVTLIANARYMLMSCALSQRLSSAQSFLHRLAMAFAVTDELFGIAISRPGVLNPYYYYGGMAVAIPGWSIGTACGIIAGAALPERIVSALSAVGAAYRRYAYHYPHCSHRSGCSLVQAGTVPAKGGLADGTQYLYLYCSHGTCYLRYPRTSANTHS